MMNVVTDIVKSLISPASASYVLRRTWVRLFVVLMTAIGPASVAGYAQVGQGQDQYVMPQPITSKGLAPKMKYKDLGQQAKCYVVIFGSGDEVASGLTEFAANNHIQSGHLTGIGGLQRRHPRVFRP